MSRKFQFSLRALLVAMLVVAAFFGGMIVQREVDQPVHIAKDASEILLIPGSPAETIVLRDGSHWLRLRDD